MKRSLWILLIAIMCIFLCACGKSEAAETVDNMILAIGEVTLDSDPAITQAEEAVKNMYPEDLKQLDELETLKAARAAYEHLVLKEKAKPIEEAIDAIGTVSLDQVQLVRNARKAYENAEEAVQPVVENYSVLEEAERQIRILRAEQVVEMIDKIGEVTLESARAVDTAKQAYQRLSREEKEMVTNRQALEDGAKKLSQLEIQQVIDLIDQIGEVTIDSKGAINKARSYYVNLSYEQKDQVTNYQVMKTAQKRLRELEDELEKEREALEKEEKAAKRAQELRQILGSFRSETDKVQGVSWYFPSGFPAYANSRSYALPYIGVSESSKNLRLRFHYAGNNWVFFTSIVIYIDGNTYQKDYSYTDVKRDNSGGMVWEWVDMSVGGVDRTMLEEIAESTETIIRFQGDTYHYDLTVGSGDKAAITQVLNAYDQIKG